VGQFSVAVSKVEGATEALDGGDCSGFAVGDALSTSGATIPAEDGPDEDVADAAAELAIEGQEVAQPDRDREYPLSHGNPWYHAIDEVRCTVRHPAASTGRTETPALAREGDQGVLAAGGAVDPSEAVGQDSAAQVGAELLLHEIGEPPASSQLLGLVEESLQGLLDDLIQESLLGFSTQRPGGEVPPG
jgi:hypothetical protein